MNLTLDEDNISKKYRVLDILSIAIENDREIHVRHSLPLDEEQW